MSREVWVVESCSYSDYRWAEREAKDHGVDTTTDNWLHILPEDDRVAIYFDVEAKQ